MLVVEVNSQVYQFLCFLMGDSYCNSINIYVQNKPIFRVSKMASFRSEAACESDRSWACS